MKKSRRGNRLPLFLRELHEQSARPRTYVARVIYALALYGITLWQASDQLSVARTYGSGVQVLGSGGRIFQTIVGWQYAGVLLVMPVITAGAIAGERERNTLLLLLGTHLSPLEIVLQKLASRMLVMLSLIAMSIPLMAFAYSLGGVDEQELSLHVASLILTALLIGAYSMFWSARSSSTTGAMLGTLLTFPLLLLITGCCCGQMIGAVLFTGGQSQGATGYVAVYGLASVIGTVIFLSMATDIMINRIELPSKGLVGEAFHTADQVFHNANQVFGGIELVSDRQTLPTDRPVAWLSLRGRALSKLSHQVRVVLLMEIVACFALIPLLADARWGGRWESRTGGMVMFLELVALLFVTTSASGMIPGWRGRETLPVLATTPLESRAILSQAMHGLHRLILLLTIPLATILLARMYVFHMSAESLINALGWLFGATSGLLMSAWLAVAVSLHVKTQLQSLLFSVGLVFGWIFFAANTGNDVAMQLNLLFPSLSFLLLEEDPLALQWLPGLLTLVLLLTVLRWYCLKNADRFLGRC